MRRIISLTALSISLVGGVAAAEPHRETVRVHEDVHVRAPVVRENVHVREDVHVRGPVVRESVHVNGPVVRESVHVNGPVVRESVHVNGPVVHETVRVGGPVVRESVVVRQPDFHERVVIREPGRAGVVVRGGPVWREGVRFTDYSVRPEYRYEEFAPITGYGWHRGDWVWNGYEWIWQPGWYVQIGIE